MMTDPIADFLARVRNATLARHDTVSVPFSRIKARIAHILAEEGFVKGVTEDAGRKLVIELKYQKGGKPIIHGIRRVSKPGRRVYLSQEKIPKVLNGLGVAVLSTSRGVVTDAAARELNVGGEHILSVW
ncbi:MAG: 30S ribosomal protein S8 [Deltaproteobacteria bacterium]|nr:30S ribosomal protein S8 [Deltaproteobacteria bacterium]